MREQFGEFLGTFILVFIGCGSVALAILYGELNLIAVATIWGLGVALAIFAARSFSPAHLNPVVSLAMFLRKEIELKKLVSFVLIQLIGAFCAAATLYLIFRNDIADFESANNITRGSLSSQATAAMFGEFFPNPGYADRIQIDWPVAALLEAFGTFLLVAVILIIIRVEKIPRFVVPFLIGTTVSLIICLIAPYTQAGLNPARDFGPRVLAYFAGWGNGAFPTAVGGFFTVYILGPILGSSLAVYLGKTLKKK